MSITNVPFFSPRSITGCSLWFDATDSSTITLSSGSLTQWNDKSGNGKNFTAVSGFANATVSSAYQNGLNVFNFSGNGLYRTPAGSAVYPQDAYIIVALKSTTAHVDVLGMGDTATDNFNSLTFAESAASKWHNGSSGGARQTISDTTETSTSFLLMQWSIANGNYLLRRNGTQLIQASRTYSFNNSSTAIFQIGYRHTDNVYGSFANFSGYIGEIAVFNSQLGTTDRQNIESYLAQKWGLTAGLSAGHPGLISTVYKSPIPISLVPVPFTAITYAFAPTQITGCSLWLDGADPAGTGVVPAIGAAITTWADKSGLGNTATNQGSQGTVTFTAAGLVFNGYGYFYMPSLAGNLVNKAFVIFMVETLNTTGGTMLIGDDAQTNYGTNNVLHIMYRSSTNHTFAFYANDLENTNVSGTGTRRLWTFWLPTASNRVTRRNGAVDVTHGNYSRLNYWSTPAIGRGFGGYNYVGTMSEVIIYPSDIGISNIQKVEAYLGQKWGLKSSLGAGHVGLTTDYFNSQSILSRAAITIPPRLAKIPLILSGLTNRWTLNEGTGSVFYDSVAGQTGTLYGSPTWVTVTNTRLPSLTKAIYFSNISPTENTQYGQIGSGGIAINTLTTANWSISLWYNARTFASHADSGNTYLAINSPTSRYWNFYIGNGSGNLYNYSGSGAGGSTSISGTISFNSWTHIVYTCSSSSIAVYINGSSAGTGTWPSFSFSATTNLFLGIEVISGGYIAYGCDMYMQDVRIYNRPLSATEVTSIYNNLG